MGLYVNLTNRCPCAFCIRNNGKGAYGSDSLWLEREPTMDVVMTVVATADFTDVKRTACEAICAKIGVPLRVRTLVARQMPVERLTHGA